MLFSLSEITLIEVIRGECFNYQIVTTNQDISSNDWSVLVAEFGDYLDSVHTPDITWQ